ncbi:cytochrome P450 [Sphingomonas paucimobilis]|uniref:Cytochrome P450 n=1 Tax=Sphingomonas paucimobilis TaxID=13689 RepID=A0A7Y2KRF4_SPHPI|nr:cytochrome P450 [Sphingomonas paucimobilis]NNG58797.1 cytochrome P450 [Sphingomonas paucimobilis]
MPKTPHTKGLDETLALLADPYRFISSQCQRLGANAFETRVLLKKTTCLKGAKAAEIFYDATRFKREGAMPTAIQKTLLGQGGVQGLDGETHRHRKQMFMSLMTPERVRALARLFEAEWRGAVPGWTRKGEIVFYDELHEPLARAVCAWAGVPLSDDEASNRAGELRALFDAAGSASPRHLWSRLARRRVDTWAARIIEDIRAGSVGPGPETAAYAVAWHRDRNGSLLSPHVAAVELVNVLRPTVAIAVYITFVAHALQTCSGVRAALAQQPDYAELFVQEVRRFYPFFPAVVARARRDFEWEGMTVPEGRQAMLDLYGSTHDAAIWADPEKFRPERFRAWNEDSFNFIPQGGGDHYLGHRCPGEWIVLAIMKVAAHLLVNAMRYDVPDQDLSIDFARLPALPKSGFVMRNVHMAD